MNHQKWARKHQRCINCSTTRYSHKARGYCTRCYRLVKRIEEIKKWDITNPSSLKNSGNAWVNRNDPKRLERLRRGCIEQIESRLEFLKDREVQISGNEDVEGINIEFQLKRLARIAKANDKVFHGTANLIDWNFSQQQKTLIFSLLNQIEENRPWRIDFYRAWGLKSYQDETRDSN